MNLDLRDDFKTLSSYVEQRVREYPTRVNAGPGDRNDSISNIEFGYQFDQSGWVALVFDTRPDAEPDGEWNSYIEDNALEMDHWYQAIEDLMENGSTLTITRHDGSQQQFTDEADEEQLAASFGQLLQAVLIAARDRGLFAKLPLAKGCLMGVEEQTGHFGWPEYDKRLTEGRVN